MSRKAVNFYYSFVTLKCAIAVRPIICPYLKQANVLMVLPKTNISRC